MKWDHRLTEQGIVHTPRKAAEGQFVYRLVEAEYLGPWGGRHNVFIEVLDAAGGREVGVPVRWYWHDGEETRMTEAKPRDDWAIDFPMHEPGNSYGVEMLPGDRVWGFGLGPGKEHVNYRLVFRLMPYETLPPPSLVLQAADRMRRGQELLVRAQAEFGAAQALLNQVGGAG